MATTDGPAPGAIERIEGNYLTQANRDFPMDCETLDYLQELTRIAGLAGNVGGDKTILCGCATTNAEGTRRAPGWVFLKTKAHPEGETLWWEGGPTTSGMYLKAESVPVSANNTDYPKAYTRRTLAPGIGSESYRWEDFKAIMSVRELMAENQSLRDEIAGMKPAPLGIVQMWAGAAVPEGYLLCDGQQLKQSEWPELYKALGTTFNSAVSASGTPYQTQAGYFRVPDLRGRFVVGMHDSDSEYNTRGAAGGVKKVTLTEAQTPAHTHKVKDYMMIPHGTGECTTGNWTVGGVSMQVGYDSLSGNPKRSQTDGDKRGQVQWIKHDTESGGKGEAHENRPPYYVMAYIMRAR